MSDDIKILQAPNVRIIQSVLNKALEQNPAGGVTVWIVSIGHVVMSGQNDKEKNGLRQRGIVVNKDLDGETKSILPESQKKLEDFRVRRTNLLRDETLEALERCDWNRRAAAEMLGITLCALSTRIHRLNLKPVICEKEE